MGRLGCPVGMTVQGSGRYQGGGVDPGGPPGAADGELPGADLQAGSVRR